MDMVVDPSQGWPEDEWSDTYGIAPGDVTDPVRAKVWEALRHRDLDEKIGQGGVHWNAVWLAFDLIKKLFEEQKRQAFLGLDTFVEWDPNDPRARISADLFVVDGADASVTPFIWQTWVPGHDVPSFAMEVVSHRSRVKDYEVTPFQYAALGVQELLLFDYEPVGVDTAPLRLFRRTERGQFLLAYAGSGPVESRVLGASWVVEAGGKVARVARDAEGKHWVLTAGEWLKKWRERAKEANAEADAMAARADVAEARVRELEILLREQGGIHG